MTLSVEKLRNIDFEKLYHFYLIFRERSIKKVSDHHNLSTSTLRHSLLTLETKLDLKLYRPSKKTFIPTEDGVKFFELCRSIIEVVNTYQNESDKEEEKKDFIILTTTTIANYYLPAILKKFDDYYPDVQIQVYCGPEYFLNLSNYAFDVIIAPKINNINLAIKKLGKFTYKFYCSPDLKKRLSHLKSPTELKDQNLLLLSGVHMLDEIIIKQNKIKAISNSYPFLLHLCAQGLGILSCFNTKIFESLHLNIDIQEIFSDYTTESEELYFSYNRLTDKGKMIDNLFSLTDHYLEGYEII